MRRTHIPFFMGYLTPREGVTHASTDPSAKRRCLERFSQAPASNAASTWPHTSITDMLKKASPCDACIHEQECVWPYLVEQLMGTMNLRDIITTGLQPNHCMGPTFD